ncbi:hypothetical protein D3C80_931950 [compost metagenome]
MQLSALQGIEQARRRLALLQVQTPKAVVIVARGLQHVVGRLLIHLGQATAQAPQQLASLPGLRRVQFMAPGTRPKVPQFRRISPVALRVLDAQFTVEQVAGHLVGRLMRAYAGLAVDVGILADGSMVTTQRIGLQARVEQLVLALCRAHRRQPIDK